MPRSTALTKQDLEEHLGRFGEKLYARIDKLDSRMDSLEAKLDATNAVVHRNGVFVEQQLAPKVQAALEGTTAARDELLRAMSEMECRLDRRITDLEAVVRSHSAAIQRLVTEVAELREQFERRDDLAAVERRVAEIERQLARRAT